ncbi:MAG: hypothetical protein KDC38_13580, partial [Planctomycetes bacterium]|nr:hypothetical protein [Planctomycetota bacterium]
LYDPIAHLLRYGTIETIVVLSDGEPTAGRYRETEPFLDAIARLNQYSRTKIHCIALGENSTLLERLAADNGGIYRRADLPPEPSPEPEEAEGEEDEERPEEGTSDGSSIADARRGTFSAIFKVRSPRSAIDAMIARDAYNGRERPKDYVLADHSFLVHVPEEYRADASFGLLVWIDPSERGHVPFATVLDGAKLLCASPDDAGNDASIWVRAGLALDAVHNMKRRFVLDEKRIYVAGFSGGGRMASRLGVMYADEFAGAMPIDGTDWWEDLPADEFPGKWFRGRYQKPVGEIWKKAVERNRYVLVTGEHDGNRPGTKAAYHHGFEKAGFEHVTYVEIPGKRHEWPSIQWFEKLIDRLDPPARRR